MKFMPETAIVNTMEPIVIRMFEDTFLSPEKLKCACPKCQLDIIVRTLNKLPPRYTSTQTGETLVKLNYTDVQMQSDVLRELTESIKVIEANPNH